MGRLLGSVALAAVLACAQVDHNQAGRTLLAQKNWKAALAEFQQAPASTDTHIGAGIALWGIGDHKGALTEFQRATESNPKSAEAHLWLGIALRIFGRPVPVPENGLAPSGDIMLAALEALNHPDGNFRLLQTGAVA